MVVGSNPSIPAKIKKGKLSRNLYIFIKRSVKPTDAVGSVGCKRPLTLGDNILKQGINILSGSGIESYVKQKRDEALPLGKSMTPEAQPIAFGVGG